MNPYEQLIAEKKIRPFWSETFERWFSERLAEVEAGSDAEARLIRFATDRRMEPVAKRLAREECRCIKRKEPTDCAVQFLERAWRAPDVWAAQLAAWRQREAIKEIQNVSHGLRELAKAHRDTLLRFGYHHGGMTLAQATAWLDSVISNIETLEVLTERGLHTDPIEGFWALPSNMGDSRAEQLFCVMYLMVDAHLTFRKHPYDHVATIVTVLLCLKNDLSPESVKQLFKDRGRKKGMTSAILMRVIPVSQ